MYKKDNENENVKKDIGINSWNKIKRIYSNYFHSNYHRKRTTEEWYQEIATVWQFRESMCIHVYTSDYTKIYVYRYKCNFEHRNPEPIQAIFKCNSLEMF